MSLVGPAVSNRPMIPAKVSEFHVELKTYPSHDPQQLPSLLHGGWPRNIYPYAHCESDRDAKPVLRKWRVLRLENEFLEVDVLPELGGHVWGARDKLRNAEIFHRVDAIKPSDLGVAGKWIATGIEFNFPVTHSVLTMAEIHASFGTKPDGLAFVCIGATDKLFGLRWQMHLTLAPRSRQLHISGWLHNPTENEHPWCYWGNAGVSTHESLRLYYPFTWAEHHGGMQFKWPQQYGRDLTYWRELPEPVSIFGETGEARWFGGYYEAFGRGVVHTADPKVLPGKKYFAWGHGAAGQRWAELLSDNRTGYVELQAGSRNDQEFWNVLAPHETVRIAECWQPIDALGGITAANEHLVIYIDRPEGEREATVRAQPSEDLFSVEFIAYQGKQEIGRWLADLAPERVHEHTLKLSNIETPVRVEARPADRARELIALERPEFPARPASREETTDLGEVSGRAYRRIGLDAAQRSDWALARTFFEAALELAPEDAETLRAVGLFRLRRFEYDGAAQVLKKALSRCAGDRAVADRSLRWGLWWAKYNLLDPRTESADLARAAMRLLAPDPDLFAYASGLLLLATGQPGEVLAEYDERPLPELVGKRDLAVMKLAAARRHGKPHAALLEEMRRNFPTDPIVACEAGEEALCALLRVDADAGVSAACEYLTLHDFAMAQEALARTARHAGWTLSRRVLAAWIAHQAGDEAAAQEHLNAETGFDGIHDKPWQEAFYRALPWALECRPGDARLSFLWGSLLAHAGRSEEALRAWETSIRLGGAWPTLHFCAALLQAQLGGAGEAKIARLKAIAEREDAWEYRAPYLDVLRLSGRRRERLAELKRLMDTNYDSTRVPIAYALEACVAEDPDTALNILLHTEFPPTHGGGVLSYSHIRLRRGRAERALAAGDLAAAQRELDEGEKVLHHFREDVQHLRFKAALHCTRAKLEETRGDAEAARRCYEAAVAEEHDLRSPLRPYRGLALIKLGRVAEGEADLARVEAMARARLNLPHPHHAHYLYLLAETAGIRGDLKAHERLMAEAIAKGVLFMNWGWGF